MSHFGTHAQHQHACKVLDKIIYIRIYTSYIYHGHPYTHVISQDHSPRTSLSSTVLSTITQVYIHSAPIT